MQIPLDFWNVSLRLAVTAIILLITAQLASAYDGPATLLIEKKTKKSCAGHGRPFLDNSSHAHLRNDNNSLAYARRHYP